MTGGIDALLGQWGEALRAGQRMDGTALYRGAARILKALDLIVSDLKEYPAPPGLDTLDQCTLQAAELYSAVIELLLHSHAARDRCSAQEALQLLQQASELMRLVRQTAIRNRRTLEGAPAMVG